MRKKILLLSTIFITLQSFAMPIQEGGDGLILIEQKNVAVAISGLISQALNYVYDGYDSNLFVVSNENHTSRLNLTGTINFNPNVTVGGIIEFGLKANPSDVVSQNDHSATSSIELRKVEVFVNSKQYGRFLLGRGNTATYDTAELDLSGTDFIAHSAIQDLYGGIFFRSSNTPVYINNPTVGDAFDSLNGAGRLNRIRYDTPKFYNFYLSGSYIEDKVTDIALRYIDRDSETKIEAAMGLTSPITVGNVHGHQFSGSITILLNNGISTTGSAGLVNAESAGRDNPYYYYFKLGYQKDFWPIGLTALSVDYGRYLNFNQNSDIGQTYAISGVQNFEKYNLAVYLGYRFITLDRTDARFKDLNSVAGGAYFYF
jgi:hypothetical protein